MLVLAGIGTFTLMMVVIFVNLVDQPEMLKVHVRRCGQPEGHQQQRDDAPNDIHGRTMESTLSRVQGLSWQRRRWGNTTLLPRDVWPTMGLVCRRAYSRGVGGRMGSCQGRSPLARVLRLYTLSPQVT